MKESREQGYCSTTFCNKGGDTQADILNKLAKLASPGNASVAALSANGACHGLAVIQVVQAMCGGSDEANKLVKFLKKWAENPAPQFLDITYEDKAMLDAVLIRTWVGEGTAAKIKPVAFVSNGDCKDWLDESGDGPKNAANSTPEIAVSSGQEALKRLQQLGGVTYVQSRGAT